MDWLFDFSNPAKRCKELIIDAAIKLMVFSMILGLVAGIFLLVVLAENLHIVIGLVALLVCILLGFFIAITIRNATFYRLAILDACRTITLDENDDEDDEYDEDEED